MAHANDTGVFLRDTRNYVQGTQVIARAAACLEGSDWRFERAVFTQITRHTIRFSEPVADADPIGILHFIRESDETREIRVFEADALAPRRDHDMTVEATRSSVVPSDPAFYDFTGVCVFEDMLNAIVIAIKAEHLLRFQGCSNVWLTGLRNLGLPVDRQLLNSGVVRISMIREMRKYPACQTLWRLDINDDAGATFSNGAVTFSYEPREDSFAD